MDLQQISETEYIKPAELESRDTFVYEDGEPNADYGIVKPTKREQAMKLIRAIYKPCKAIVRFTCNELAKVTEELLETAEIAAYDHKHGTNFMKQRRDKRLAEKHKAFAEAHDLKAPSIYQRDM